MEPASQHISIPNAPPQSAIPPLAVTAPLPPPPKPTKASERYSIVVNNVLAQEILFALARDAKLNIEIHPGITGTVTMNLLDRTLPEILDAIARQVDMRYELNGSNLAIMPDSPFLKSYQIEYPNVARDAKNGINMSTSIAVIGKGQGSSGGLNGSNSSINNISDNHFWETLTENIKDILRETDKQIPTGESNSTEEAATSQNSSIAPPTAAQTAQGALPNLPAQVQNQNTVKTRRTTFREAAYVIANPETGIISVRATARQHASIREFLDKVLNNARRQVLIEATIVEVSLSDQYQQGIDWTVLTNFGLSLTQLAAPQVATNPVATIGTIRFVNPGNGKANLSGIVSLLEGFGKLHVLSSPKLSVLNNQTGLVKVVDESVYFTVEVTAGTVSSTGILITPPTYTTTVHTVPVGFMMYVTPQIGGDDEITLNLRPTITRILSYANDPNPALAQYAIVNRIPQIQTRELESILRVRDGEIAVLGGLMQDERKGDTSQVPGLGSIPGLGELFKSRNDTNRKTELVVFLRPVILNTESQFNVVQQFKNPTSTPEWQQKPAGVKP